ncbi:MAG: hypothetical protein KDA86_08625 [Planctomycetaceae bacterium]|nr:hypothetical protein [Planctomycetaceae bacterium]
MTSHLIRTALIIVFAGSVGVSTCLSAGRPGQLERILESYEERHVQFAADMEELAQTVDGQMQPGVSATIRHMIPVLEEQTFDVDALPDEVTPELDASLPEDERQWRSQLKRIRTEYAHDLYLLSRQALNTDHVSLAFHLVREVAFHDSDHQLARQLLGYVRYQDRWVTPYEKDMLSRGNVWDPKFGWLPKSHVDRYEQGERFFRGRWMSADDEASLRHHFENGWEIESDHFLIKTNQSLERGVELSVALERFHRFFQREFAAVFNSPQQMLQLFNNGKAGARQTTRRHQIHYYQSKEEFVFRLRDRQEKVEFSNGLYRPDDRTAYFFYDPEDLETNTETLYHEVTHQLLSESQRTPPQVGQKANFWLIEGLACYLESFEVDDQGRVSVGDPRHIRVERAWQRRIEENIYFPLAQFTALGMNEFQRPNELEVLRQYYSQATGLTHFFLHYEEGVYRDALIQHLSQIYSPNPRVRTSPDSMAKLTGVPFAELDQQYLSYMTELNAVFVQLEDRSDPSATLSR